jgi:outer membrane protein W
MTPQKFKILILCWALLCVQSARAELEIFGKGMVAKNWLASDSYTLDVSGSAGFAFTLFSSVRFEARYTNITEFQNKLAIVSTNVVGTLQNILTETEMATVGLDINFADEKSAFQPYVYVGVGYSLSQRSYYFSPPDGSSAQYVAEPKQAGITGNVGLGFRLRVARRLAIEIEAFGYDLGLDQPNPLINWYGSAGIRIFI